MDASNLAICVGPNMLTRENDQNLSLEAQKDLNNQVCSRLFLGNSVSDPTARLSVRSEWCSASAVRPHSEVGDAGCLVTVPLLDAQLVNLTKPRPRPSASQRRSLVLLMVTSVSRQNAFPSVRCASHPVHLWV